MKVIGLTGNICSGKSTVADFLAKRGAVVISADQIGHQALRPFTDTWKKVVEAFGQDVVGENNEIDRQKLGEIVFADPEALSRLNNLIHPGMHEVARHRIEQQAKTETEVVVLEAALLIEADWLDLVDEVWVTHASEETVVKRCRRRSGLSEDQAKSRIGAQMPAEEKIKRADVIINTDVSLSDVEAKIDELWRRLVHQNRHA